MPPSQIIVINRSRAPLQEVGFWVAAVRAQALAAARAWGWEAPDVLLFERGLTVDHLGGAAITIADSASDLSFGGPWEGGIDVSQLETDLSVALSHEVLGMLGNARLDRWFHDGRGKLYSGELCDPVQCDIYRHLVRSLDITSNVPVSNFVFPSWFMPDGVAPFDYLGRLTAPFSLGPWGYAVCRDVEQGNPLLVSHPDGALLPARKTSRRSRTRRLLGAPF